MASSGLDTEIIEDWPALASLEREWNSLLDRSSADSVFLTWEWVEAWREAIGQAVRPFVVAVREAGELVALAPLYRARLRLGGVLPFRALRVIGDYQSGAEYGDWIVRRDHDEKAAFAIAQALAAVGTWDCLWMPNVSAWNGAAPRILAAARAAGLTARERARPFSVISLPTDSEAFQTSLSSNMRSMLNRRRKQILGLPGARFLPCRTEAERSAFVEALFDLNARRWRAKGALGTFARKPVEARFYRCFTSRALARGWLRLFAIELSGELKAVQAGYGYKGVFYQLQEGFDPAGPPGLGNALRSEVISALIHEGIHTYDFLGGFTEHKRHWGARVREGRDLLIGTARFRSALLLQSPLWPTGRLLRPVPLGR